MYTPNKDILTKEITDRVNSELLYYKDEQGLSLGGISDGYHTFDELYTFRKMYNATLFNEWASGRMTVLKGMQNGRRYENAGLCKYNVHKSWRHEDGELCFGGGWFIVVAMLPDGQISNHYKEEDWGLFNIPETPKALYPFDGHTGQDVIFRLSRLI